MKSALCDGAACEHHGFHELHILQTKSAYFDEPACKTCQSVYFDLIICPALAVDLNGNRIGYGQGYYDRYLLKASNAKFIALIFDFQ